MVKLSNIVPSHSKQIYYVYVHTKEKRKTKHEKKNSPYENNSRLERILQGVRTGVKRNNRVALSSSPMRQYFYKCCIKTEDNNYSVNEVFSFKVILTPS